MSCIVADLQREDGRLSPTRTTKHLQRHPGLENSIDSSSVLQGPSGLFVELPAAIEPFGPQVDERILGNRIFQTPDAFGQMEPKLPEW